MWNPQSKKEETNHNWFRQKGNPGPIGPFKVCGFEEKKSDEAFFKKLIIPSHGKLSKEDWIFLGNQYIILNNISVSKNREIYLSGKLVEITSDTYACVKVGKITNLMVSRISPSSIRSCGEVYEWNGFLFLSCKSLII